MSAFTSANTVGLDEIAVLGVYDLRRHPAGHQPRAVVVAELADRTIRGRAWRTEITGPSWVEGSEVIADPDGFGLGFQLGDEFIVDRGLHDMARGADAGLAGADEGAERHLLVPRAVDVGIVEHHHRRLAAELPWSDAANTFAAAPAGDAARFSAAGQNQLVDVGMFSGEHPAGALPQAQHDVEHAGRQARFR